MTKLPIAPDRYDIFDQRSLRDIIERALADRVVRGSDIEHDGRFIVRDSDGERYALRVTTDGYTATTRLSDGADIAPPSGGGGGVTSFATRTGDVVPTAGDYDAFYYTEGEVDALLGDYYTDGEVDTLLAAKAAVAHTHAPSDITGWPANAAGVLTNDGAGVLTWGASSAFTGSYSASVGANGALGTWQNTNAAGLSGVIYTNSAGTISVGVGVGNGSMTDGLANYAHIGTRTVAAFSILTNKLVCLTAGATGGIVIPSAHGGVAYALNVGGISQFQANLRISAGHIYNVRSNQGSSGATKTINWATSGVQKLTLSANCTISFSNPNEGGFYFLELRQDGTGGRTVTWPANVKWAGGTAPTLTTTANRTDLITFYFDGSYYCGVVSGQNFAN